MLFCFFQQSQNNKMNINNFYNPGSRYDNDLIDGNLIHKEFDVDPYSILGNSPKDNTTDRNRGYLRVIDAYR